MAKYKYLDEWNDMLNQPILVAGRGWLDEPTARDRYEVAHQFFSVANAEVGDGLVVPEFVLGVSPGDDGPWVRADFYTQGGAVYRSIDYKSIEGRLFKWIVRERTYPDETKRYRLNGATSSIEASFEPSGYGSLRLSDKSQPTMQFREYNDVPVESHWMPIPEFGDWGQLTNPDFGV